MSPNSQQPNNAAETVSTADVQQFEDEGGMPLDHPVVLERERRRKPRPQKDDLQPPDSPAKD